MLHLIVFDVYTLPMFICHATYMYIVFLIMTLEGLGADISRE